MQVLYKIHVQENKSVGINYRANMDGQRKSIQYKQIPAL